MSKILQKLGYNRPSRASSTFKLRRAHQNLYFERNERIFCYQFSIYSKSTLSITNKFYFPPSRTLEMSSNATGFMLQTMLFMVNHSSTDFMHTVFNETLPHPIDPNEEKCFGAYGCFPIGFPWACESRAHNVL